MPFFLVSQHFYLSLHRHMEKKWYKTKAAWAKLVLKRDGYDPFIDYLKGICIIFVIINHCMPENIMANTGFFFWGVSAVPIFLIIQVFHAYKNGVDHSKLKHKKIWRRIVWPFILAESVILIVFLFRDQHFTYKEIVNDILCLIKSGGYGPGAYYPFIYLQFAIILPFITWVFRSHKPYLCICFVIISQLSETACSYFHLPQLAYRLLFIRYIFLFYLGFLLAYKGFILNLFTFCLAFICLVFSTYVVYSHQNFTPVLYDFVNPACHWFCYIFIAFFLFFLLRKIYYYFDSVSILKNYVIKAGKYSYEIFLFQIVYFAIANDYINNLLKHYISYYHAYALIKILLPVILCTIPIIFYKEKK